MFPWYEVMGMVIVALTVVGAFLKNAQWKKRIEKTKVVMTEAQVALQDGKITKNEWIKIATTALTEFIPEEE